MSGYFWLDWAILAVSLFNTILALWLGLTLLLNADRRAWGIWLAGGGLLLGAAFFFSHTAILGLGLEFFTGWSNFWWRVGWIPVVLAPFAWYVVMLWYSGYWDPDSRSIRQRHRPWLIVLAVLTVSLLTWLVFANPLPAYIDMLLLNLSGAPALFGVPVLLLVYPPYILLCIGLSLDALLRPGPTLRMMGQLARQRARPWLAAASLALLGVSLLVGLAMFRVALSARQYTFDMRMEFTIAGLDLLIETLIALAISLTGQAIVSYEVFTGKALPRRGLRRYWQRAFILAVGYSAVVSLSLVLRLPSIYSLLLSTTLMVAFYALLSWRSFSERENMMAEMRPFVTSQQLYNHLLDFDAQEGRPELSAPFCALCQDVLDARLAYLIPLGSLAPLFGPPLACPGDATPPQAELAGITARLESPADLCLPLDAEMYAGAAWAVPLWNERGLAGLLLLGEKQDGGLYTQEEIEFARAASERLMDLQASAEMARRLMILQRRQMAESQVVDRQARRVLHDDVLPSLHAAMLALGQADNLGSAAPESVALLSDAHRQIANLLHDLPSASAPEVARKGLLEALRQLVEGEMRQAFDTVEWRVGDAVQQYARRIPPLTAEVVFYAAREAVRNAARHGRGEQPSRKLHLCLAVDWQDGLQVLIEDNGVGIAAGQAAGEGSGQGLSLHSTMLAVLGGSLAVESIPGTTRVRIILPASSLEALIQEAPAAAQG